MRHQRLDMEGFVSRGEDDALRPSSAPLAQRSVSGPVEREVADHHRPAETLFRWLGRDSDEATQPNILDHLLRIHEYERQRLGQELHDSAGQLLVSLQLSVAHLRAVEADRAHDNLLDEINDTVRQIDREIRALAFLHYPTELGDRDLCGAVRSLARGFESRTGISTSVRCACDTSVLDADVSTALLRVTQEALVNVHRHAHAERVAISLKQRRDSIELSISDDGIGIPAEKISKATGIGVQGMRHRIEVLGGHFAVTALEHGTKISGIVPLTA